MNSDSLARQQRQLVFKAVNILREIIEEAPSEANEKVVKLSGSGLGNTSILEIIS
jgi:hypothetical protein